MASGGVDHFGLVGQVLDGQFRVDSVLGEGGFSVVYKGHHLGLSEPIAIKCLKLPASLGSALVESFVRRFRDESRIHYQLSQGNLHICRSIASGTTMAPATSALVPFMVLEWLDGKSLAEELLERRSRGEKGRTLAEAIKFLDPAVDAVAYAHAQGVVHRDLNPGNFFLTKTREGVKLKILDFGVAKIMNDHSIDLGPRAPTLGQIRIFSPAYGAPEQFDEKLGPVGPWTDVYALSLVMLEVLTDRAVVEGEHIGELALKTLDAGRRPSPRAMGVTVGDEVLALFKRSFALVPKERPQDAGEFWGMLKNAQRRDNEASSVAVGSTVRAGGAAHFVSKSTLMAGSASPMVERTRSSSPPAGGNAVPRGSKPPPDEAAARRAAQDLKATLRIGSTPNADLLTGAPSPPADAGRADVPAPTLASNTQPPPPGAPPAVAPSPNIKAAQRLEAPPSGFGPGGRYDSSYGHKGPAGSESGAPRPLGSRPNVSGGLGTNGSSRPPSRPAAEEMGGMSATRIALIVFGILLVGSALGIGAWWVWFSV